MPTHSNHQHHGQRQRQHQHEDDLLFDNLITDISEYMAVHESTASGTVGDDTAAQTSASPAATSTAMTTPAAADNETVTGGDDGVIYQNIAAVRADKLLTRYVLVY